MVRFRKYLNLERYTNALSLYLCPSYLHITHLKIYWFLVPFAVAAARVLVMWVGRGGEGRRRSRSRGRPGPPTGDGYLGRRGAPQSGSGADSRPALSIPPNLKYSMETGIDAENRSIVS